MKIIYILLISIYVLYIWCVSYYFANKTNEHFDCNLGCDINFVNKRIRVASIWIPYLESLLKLLNPIKEDFTDKPIRIIKRISNLENYYNEIHIKILKIAEYKNITLPKINLDVKLECYTAKTCRDEKLLTIISDYLDRLDQIDYLVSKLYNNMLNDITYNEEMVKERANTIKKVNQEIDNSFKNLLGFNFNSGFSDYANNPELTDKVSQSIKSGDLTYLKSLAEDPKIIEASKKIDRERLLANLTGETQNSSDLAKTLFTKSLNKRDPLNKELLHPDAEEAQSTLDDNIKKIKLPDKYKKYVKPDNLKKIEKKK